MRKTLITKLDEEDVIQNQFSKSARKNIRRALNKGITYKITKTPDNINSFKEIYYSTMDRNNATDYYYFDDEYFENVLKYYRENLLFVEAYFEDKVIASRNIFYLQGYYSYSFIWNTFRIFIFITCLYFKICSNSFRNRKWI